MDTLFGSPLIVGERHPIPRGSRSAIRSPARPAREVTIAAAPAQRTRRIDQLLSLLGLLALSLPMRGK